MRPFLWLGLALLQVPSPTENTLPLTPPLLRERFVQDIASHNLDDLLTLFTRDAELVSVKATPVSGQAALRSYFAEEYAHQDTHLTLAQPTHMDEGEPRHPTAIIDKGRYTQSTGQTPQQCGAYTFRYVKNPEGGWLIARMEWTAEPCPTAR